MHLRNEKGQALVMMVLIVGVLLSLVVLFGVVRQRNLSVLTQRLDQTQKAQELLSSALKRVQHIYANESSCDPDVLDERLSNLSSLPADPAEFELSSSHVYDVPVAQNDPADVSKSQIPLVDRQNRCATSATGCRQLGIPFEGKIHIVTVGRVEAEARPVAMNTPENPDCARDATVRVSLILNNVSYSKRGTLINLCTLRSCDDVNNFTGVTVTAAAGEGWEMTAACGNLGSRYYGAITSTAVDNISVDDLRWARRYLETGGGSSGEASYAQFLTPPTTNGSCVPASSAGQCLYRNCFPNFDLNRDRTNNESDLAILEYLLRGYLISLPVNKIQ